MSIDTSHAPSTPSSRLDREVREVMTPGVVVIPEDASLTRIHEALVAHRVHAVLVVERRGGKPLGWVSARGLLQALAEGKAVPTAGQAVREPARTISPSATVHDATRALLDAQTSRLLVSHGEGAMPEGVVTELDVVACAARAR